MSDVERVTVQHMFECRYERGASIRDDWWEIRQGSTLLATSHDPEYAERIRAAMSDEGCGAKQAGEVERLREALLDIRNRILCPVGPSPSLDEVQEIASQALAATKGGRDG